MKTSGNTVLITGGGSGIGAALAQRFHDLGNTVIVAGRRVEALDRVTAGRPGMHAMPLDIAEAGDIAAFAERIIAEHPTLNVVINNAGIMRLEALDRARDLSDAEATITTNLLGPIRLTSALIDLLKAQPRATIIHNTSVLAYVPLAVTAVYSASKAALHSYAMSQRFMLRDTSVRVQEIAPPWVDTDLVKKSGDPRAMPLEAFIAETMAKLAGDEEEIIVESVKPLRDNPGANEHALVNGFNAALIANPIPV